MSAKKLSSVVLRKQGAAIKKLPKPVAELREQIKKCGAEVQHYVAALEAENLNLHKKVAALQAENLSTKNRVEALENLKDPHGDIAHGNHMRSLTDKQLDELIKKTDPGPNPAVQRTPRLRRFAR